MYVSMCASNLCTDMCIDMCLYMCGDMCAGMCVDMCVGMCVDKVCRQVCRHAHRRVVTHVRMPNQIHRNVQGQVPIHEHVPDMCVGWSDRLLALCVWRYVWACV